MPNCAEAFIAWLQGLNLLVPYTQLCADFKTVRTVAKRHRRNYFQNVKRICIGEFSHKIVLFIPLMKFVKNNYNISVSPSAKIDVWRILVSSIPLVYDGNRFLRFLY